MTKEEAIKTLKGETWLCCAEKWNEALDMGIEALAQTQWIPIEERVPEEDRVALIWCPERKNIYCAIYKNRQWRIHGAYSNVVGFEVSAWMPLPKPYMAEGV